MLLCNPNELVNVPIYNVNLVSDPIVYEDKAVPPFMTERSWLNLDMELLRLRLWLNDGAEFRRVDQAWTGGPDVPSYWKQAQEHMYARMQGRIVRLLVKIKRKALEYGIWDVPSFKGEMQALYDALHVLLRLIVTHHKGKMWDFAQLAYFRAFQDGYKLHHTAFDQQVLIDFAQAMRQRNRAAATVLLTEEMRKVMQDSDRSQRRERISELVKFMPKRPLTSSKGSGTINTVLNLTEEKEPANGNRNDDQPQNDFDCRHPGGQRP